MTAEITKSEVARIIMTMGIVNQVPSELFMAGLVIAVGTLAATVDDDEDREHLLGMIAQDIRTVVDHQLSPAPAGRA